MSKTIYLFIFLAFFISSCRKGCTDSQAVNYDSKAKKTDNTCTFKAKCNFWYTQSVSNNLINDGATSLTLYIDGQIRGSAGTNVYSISPPECSNTGVLNFEIDLQKLKDKSVLYQIKDQTNYLYWEGTLQFKPNDCISTQLTW